MTEVVLNRTGVKLDDRGNGGDFVVKAGRVAPELGLDGLGCSLEVIPPGKAAYPFHRHHVLDELFYVIQGEGSYRHGGETLPLKAGDIVGAPAGGEAHQILNTGSEDLHVLAVSSMSSVDVVEYPDTGKIAIGAGIRNADFRTATYRGVGHLQAAGYFDGEKGVSPEKVGA